MMNKTFFSAMIAAGMMSFGIGCASAGANDDTAAAVAKTTQAVSVAKKSCKGGECSKKAVQEKSCKGGECSKKAVQKKRCKGGAEKTENEFRHWLFSFRRRQATPRALRSRKWQGLTPS